MKRSVRLLVIICALLALYVSVIISMYEPEMAELLDRYVDLMPEIMSAVGMTTGATSLIGFMCSYLYGFILLLIPALYCIVRAHGLIAKYTDNSSMVSLLAAPLKRRTIALTQLIVLMSGILIMVLFTTVLEIICAEHFFPGELDTERLLVLNGGLFSLQLFIGGICFLASCFFSDAKYSLSFGAGIPILMFVLKMLANMGGKAENARFFTFFTLFDAEGIVKGSQSAMTGMAVLLIGGIFLHLIGVVIFCQKDLHI